MGNRERFNLETGDFERLAVFDLYELGPFFAGHFLQSQIVFQQFLRIGGAVDDKILAGLAVRLQFVTAHIQHMGNAADVIHVTVRQQEAFRFKQIGHKVVITGQAFVREHRSAINLQRMCFSIFIGVRKLVRVAADSVSVVSADGFPS